MTARTKPVVIEAAISPLRWGLPVQTVDEMVAISNACIKAGAGIVHYHHDMRLEEPQAIANLVATSQGIKADNPDTLTYTDYLKGRQASVEYAHLGPMMDAGVLSMFAVDPGITAFASHDENGLPTRTYTDGLRFAEAHEMIEISKLYNVPVSLGVFEPGQLRWIVDYHQRVGFSAGTIVKFYFGGSHLVDQENVKGINFGLPPTNAALDVYLSMLEGCHLPWIVSLFGDPILSSPLARYALERGGHIRLGEEDAAIDTGMNNAGMIAAAARLAGEVGRKVVVGADALAALRG